MTEKPMSDVLCEFLTYLRLAEDNLRMAEDEMDRTGHETQDILHRLELNDDKHHTVAALGKKLREVRRRRRVAKETVELLTPVVEWADENKKLLTGLQTGGYGPCNALSAAGKQKSLTTAAFLSTYGAEECARNAER